MTTVVRPLPGEGVVAHQSGLLLVCGPAPADTLGRLLDAVREVAADGGGGRVLARRVARVLAQAISAEPVSCAVAGPADGGVAVLVSGRATATVTGPGGEVTLTGRSALTWTDRLVGGPVVRVGLGLGAPGTGVSSADPRWRLDGGVVPGGGLECVWLQPGPGEAAPGRSPADHRRVREAASTLADEDATAVQVSGVERGRPPVASDDRQRSAYREEFRSQPFESVLLVQPPEHDPGAGTGAGTGPGAGPGRRPPVPAPPPPPGPPQPDPPQPDPRPLVWGGDCKNGHFNDPRAPYCGVCGIGMAQMTLVPRQRPRPPLGVLLIDDGMALRLDADYLLGRDPEHAAEVTSGQARPSRLTDDEGSVSRRHVRISLDQWDVRLVDLGSVNGTYVMGPGEEAYVQIPPHEPVTVVPGTKVRVGGLRTFRYESHRR